MSTAKNIPAQAGTALYLVSLGCSKNLVDTEVIAGTLLTSGRTLAFEPDEADLYVINTCAFIPAARDEAREAIEDGIVWKQEKPGRLLVVAGCLTEWDKDGSVRKEYPEVDLWTGVNQVAEIARLLDRQSTLPENAEEPVYLYDDCTPRLQLTLPHLAYLKIADGCNNLYLLQHSGNPRPAPYPADGIGGPGGPQPDRRRSAGTAGDRSGYHGLRQ